MNTGGICIDRYKVLGRARSQTFDVSNKRACTLKNEEQCSLEWVAKLTNCLEEVVRFKPKYN